jgi:non-lysosomal glucosylceramidase
LLPPEHVRTAIKAVFTHNFRPDFRKHVNCQRTFVLNDEAGLIICTWPRGGQPHFPLVYSDEVFTGIEYQVAAHLIHEGWLKEGLTVVKAIRDRHDGIRRNPWNEVECGHHYSRSMASWALLLTLSGFRCDLGRGEIRFEPIVEISPTADTFTTFWSTGRGWGTYSQHKDLTTGEWQPEIHVIGGDLRGVTIHACGQTWQL